MKMHKGEIDIDVSVVRELISAQFPKYSGLPIYPVRSTGTVNAIYRLGDEWYVRLPRVGEWTEALEKEWAWLPQLAPSLTLRIPEPIAIGKPANTYPFKWAIYRWIDGEPYSDSSIADEAVAARDLAQFVMELRSVEIPDGAPPGGRRPLRELDRATREAIEACQDDIDAGAAVEAWEHSLEAAVWDGNPVWIHADLLRPNLIVKGGRLSAVIDFGSVGIGDPATDVIPAWAVFGAEGRKAFRRALDVDDDTWSRARGIALHQAALIIPYYRTTNPEFVKMAKRTIEEIVTDMEVG